MKNPPINQVSMSRRLTVSLVAALTIIVVLVAAGFYFFTAAELERNFSRKMEETHSYLQGTLGPILWNFDFSTVAWVAETALQDDMVVGVSVRDQERNLIYSIGEQDAKGYVVKSHPVHFQNTFVGEFDLTFSHALLEDTLNRILLTSLLVWFMAVLSIGILTNIFVRKFFRGPIASFVELAQSYREHPESPPINTTPFVEFQPIENVVKKLANDVFLKLRELEEHRNDLEAEVIKQTHELRMSRNEAEAAREKAELANQAKSIFLANMSHELRTPLNAILGFSEILTRDRSTNEGQQKKLEIINRSGEHLLGMINEVLDLSKIEAGRSELEPVAFDLLVMLGDIVQMFQLRAENNGLRMTVEIDDVLARYVEADIGKVREILINLLGNAVKYTEEGGISLRARTHPLAEDPSKVTLQLEVQDSGLGISKDKVEEVFKPFTQIATALSASKKGTGLGLTITKAYVSLMGGDINVESKLGEGTVFRVDLPVALSAAADVTEGESDKPQVLGLAPGQPVWRILVVDDDEENLMLLNSLLAQVGFDIREAENGKEALFVFEEWKPHFIWMDMRMPVMDGYEATARIRALPGGDEVKIAAITASVFKEQRDKILDSGCDDLVNKPYKAHHIFDALERHLDVHFVYEQTENEGPVVAMTELTTTLLAELPAELRVELSEAATQLDSEAAEAVIERIREQVPKTADALTVLTKNYQFSRILELLGDVQ